MLHPHFRQLFQHVRKHPGMWLMVDDFPGAVAFVAGCDAATSGALLIGFKEWLVLQVGQESSYDWSALAAWLTEPVGPKDGLPTTDEADKAHTETLFRLLDEFLSIRQEPEGLRTVMRNYAKQYENWEREWRTENYDQGT